MSARKKKKNVLFILSRYFTRRFLFLFFYLFFIIIIFIFNVSFYFIINFIVNFFISVYLVKKYLRSFFLRALAGLSRSNFYSFYHLCSGSRLPPLYSDFVIVERASTLSPERETLYNVVR